MRAVEDPDHPLGGNGLMHPPEVVVTQLERRRRLERRDLTAEWVAGAEHLPDGAVFPCRIPRLEHDEQREAPVGVQRRLQFAEPLEQLGFLLLESVVIGQPSGPRGGAVVE